MKKLLNILIVTLMLVSLSACKESELSLPEISEGVRGELGIDKNINEDTIDKYLNRKDAVYRDMRMFIDDANFEAIGGDSYLSGFVKGFEVVSYPYLCNVEGLPQEVGESYKGDTLFSHEDDEYIANYAESMGILEELFPKDKIIFLMCGGGGYAGMTKNLLVNLGWDADKIYNVGGYWYYQGKNAVEVKYEEDGKTKYNFDLINYHDIDFNSLTKIHSSSSENTDVNQGIEDSNFINLNGLDELVEMENKKATFPLFVYLSGCSSCASFFPLVQEWSDNTNVQMYSIELGSIFKSQNSITDRIKYAPSMFIYKDGQVIDYLDSSNDEDFVYYHIEEKLDEWFKSSININEFETVE